MNDPGPQKSPKSVHAVQAEAKQAKQVIDKIENLGSKGWTISICYGQCGERSLLWSVDAMNVKLDFSFEKPFAVSDFGDVMNVLQNEFHDTA